MSDFTPHLLQQVRFFNIESPLLQYQNNIYSQNGEDGIIAHIINILPHAEKRYCLELGAWDGKYLSNCFNLVKNFGCHCLFIEVNKIKFELMLTIHGESKNT